MLLISLVLVGEFKMNLVIDPVKNVAFDLLKLDTMPFTIEDCNDEIATMCVGEITLILEYKTEITREENCTPDGYSLGTSFNAVDVRVEKLSLYVDDKTCWNLGMPFYMDRIGLFSRAVDVIEEKLFEFHNRE